MRTLEITDHAAYHPICTRTFRLASLSAPNFKISLLLLAVVADLATLAATYSKGFAIIIENFDSPTPAGANTVLQFWCAAVLLAFTTHMPTDRNYNSIITTTVPQLP